MSDALAEVFEAYVPELRGIPARVPGRPRRRVVVTQSASQ